MICTLPFLSLSLSIKLSFGETATAVFLSSSPDFISMISIGIAVFKLSVSLYTFKRRGYDTVIEIG